MVTVTLLDSRMAVFSAGNPRAGTVSKVPLARGPMDAGPLLGHTPSKFGHSILLNIFTPSPASHGTARLRAKNRAPKNAAKNITSEKMNHIIPIRNDRSTAMLYRPCWFSPMTVWNQKINSSASMVKPGSRAHAGIQPLRVATAPDISVNSVIDPYRGQGLL